MTSCQRKTSSTRW